MNYLSHNQIHNGADVDVEALSKELRSKDGLVRRRARQALVDIGQPAVPVLERELSSPIDHARWEAAKALCEIHAPKAAPALVNRLEDDSFSVRWLAAEALISLDRDAVIPLLEALVHRPGSVWLRQGAHHVLRVLYRQNPDPVLQPVLAALEHVEADLEVPIAAEGALNQLEGVRP